MNHIIAEWLVGHDTGASSLAIVGFMEGARTGAWDHPRDPSDLGRCIRLLDIAPEYRARLKQMAMVSPEWAALVHNWDELETAYCEADAEQDWATRFKASSALYDRMKELTDARPPLPNGV